MSTQKKLSDLTASNADENFPSSEAVTDTVSQSTGMKQTALARFVHGISEDRLATPMCHDSKRIRRGLGWIVGVCVDFLPTWRLGRCLGVSEDEVHGTESTTTLVTGASRRERQVRLMIYKWSSKDEQRGKGNVRSFLEALRSGGELDLLLQICRRLKHGSITEADKSKERPVPAMRSDDGDGSSDSDDAASEENALNPSGFEQMVEDMERLRLSDKEGERQTEQLKKGVSSDIMAREKERVSLYRLKTKAALVIQLALRRYIRRKRDRLAAEAEAKALQPQEALSVQEVERQAVGTEDLTNLQLDIPFIKQRQIITFNCSGAKFVGFGEIGIDIPQNSIPEGTTGTLEVGVCLYGPFRFQTNYRPISPILWVCEGKNTQLDKPIRVTLPHVLPDLTEEELASFGVRFAKADHDCHTDHGEERMYKFRPCLDVEPSYYSSLGKGYGVLQTKHFCHMCLVAPELGSNRSERAAVAHKSGYCLVFVRGPSVLLIFASFFLNTCLEALEERLKRQGGYRIESQKRFKLEQGKDHLQISIVCKDGDTVDMDPHGGEIYEDEIDFWSNEERIQSMKLEYDRGMYPPRVKVDAQSENSEQRIEIMVSNVSKRKLNVDFTLRPGAAPRVETQPSNEDSFRLQQNGYDTITSDYQPTNNSEKAEYSNVYPRWNLKRVHDINGNGITVAVLDSSINRYHAAFDGVELDGRNFIENTPEHYWCSNREFHGTMVVGTVTAYAPKAKIILCCVSEEMVFKKKPINEALRYLRDDPTIECQDLVIVMSFGGKPLTDEEEQNPHDNDTNSRKIRRRLISDLVNNGAVCVAAAGNDGLNVNYMASPACLPGVIAVGSIDTFSCRSRSNNPGQIDVYAPGEKISSPSAFNNRKYQEGKGSSCAAPAIGGIVALLKQHARDSGVNVNNVDLLKRIFAEKMTKSVNCGGVTEKVLDPKAFFDTYRANEEFKKMVDEL